jgi:hypothetical protein
MIGASWRLHVQILHLTHPLSKNHRQAPNGGCKLADMRKRRLSEDALDYFREQGAKGGKFGASGGKKAASNMTAAQRKARATKASHAAAVARTKKKQQKGQVGK